MALTRRVVQKATKAGQVGLLVYTELLPNGTSGPLVARLQFTLADASNSTVPGTGYDEDALPHLSAAQETAITNLLAQARTLITAEVPEV